MANGQERLGDRVAILGGGVGGLTAAQELAERGFRVTVFEAKSIPGGKARSIPVPGSGQSGRQDLPGEHGFRFFPGFYRHLPDTMRRIPFGTHGRSVYDNLVPTARVQIARSGRSNVFTPAHFPASVDDLVLSLRVFFKEELGVPIKEQIDFAEKLLVLLSSCRERRFAEYEQIDWWSFVEADERSEAFQNYCADGLTRCLVALKAREMSARTGGYILLQLMMDMAQPGSCADRILNGPTNDAWITPWWRHLESLGVELCFESRVRELELGSNGRIAAAFVESGGEQRRVDADHFIAAVPVEVMHRLINPSILQAAPSLNRLAELQTAWMVGIQFYMDREVSLARGHSLYIDSPWALTSISQKQFWPQVDLGEFGNGQVRDVLSIDVSDWDAPGIVFGKTARQCSPEEIKEEVWAQILGHFEADEARELRQAQILHWFLDPAIVFPDRQDAENLEPLLINTAGSWECRPQAVTAIPNLFLAADYVQTNTDLATMEAANEAARRAVNGLLDVSDSKHRRCRVWPLREARSFAFLRAYDRMRFRRGLPHDPRPIRTIMRYPRLFQSAMNGWRRLRGQEARTRQTEKFTEHV